MVEKHDVQRIIDPETEGKRDRYLLCMSHTAVGTCRETVAEPIISWVCVKEPCGSSDRI